MKSLNLIPAPKTLEVRDGTFSLPPRMMILLAENPATREWFAAERFEIEAEALTGVQFKIAVGGLSVDPGSEIRVLCDAAIEHEQGYTLDIAPGSIELRAKTAAGTFYAFQTLMQILRAVVLPKSKIKNSKSKIKVPCLHIVDQPDFLRRGVYHDCARGKVPTVETLLQLIDDLGHLKINEFQLYIENGFEFHKHPEMYDDTTPFTAEEILLLDFACRARHIDFVPSLTSLGHFDRILSRPAFRHLAEAEPEQLKAMGAPCWVDQPWSLCVTDPAARELLKDMYDEFVPNFSSTTMNICCDEAYDLGRVRSKELADRIGTDQMYVDWIKYCDDLAGSHGKTTIEMWGDIILKHPEVIPQLPKNVILLEWGYEADHKFDEHCQIISERIKETPEGRGGQKFYVAPGTSSWITLASRSKVAFANIHNAATAGLKYGAVGLLNTDWGDYGHQQVLSASLNAFAYSAAASWNLASVPNPVADPGADLKPVLSAISLHLFQDPAAQFAALAYDLGLSYERIGWTRFNGALEHFLFREKFDFANYVNRAPEKGLKAVIAACQKLKPKIEAANIDHPDAEKIKAELVFTCDLLVHICRRTFVRKQWLAADPAKRNPEEETLRALSPKPLPTTYRPEMKALAKEIPTLQKRFTKLWLARNKRSRLEDVLKEFDRLKIEYKQFVGS